MAAPTDSGIYEIVNLVNGKRYIGSAKNFRIRWTAHRTGLNRKIHHSRHLQAAWRKYGAEAFEFRVLCRCAPDRLIAEEQAAFDRLSPEYNVNPKAASSLGRKFTEATKAKISAKAIGRKRSPESVERGAAKLRGLKRSPDQVAHLVGNKHAAGVAHTEERRAAASAALRDQYETGARSRERPQEYREKIAEGLRQRFIDPAERERVRQQAVDAWASRSSEDRHERAAKMRAARGPLSEDGRKQISERQRGVKRPSHVMAALRAANVGRALSEEHRKKIGESSLRSWTPERKVKHAAAIRAAHARRRAAKT